MPELTQLKPHLSYRLGGRQPELGDVIAFAGKQAVSALIQRYTRSNVSHVGIMLAPDRIIESTQLQGFTGVVIRPLSEALYSYKGNAWWLPLSVESRERLHHGGWERMREWLRQQEGKPYDMKGAAAAGADLFDRFVAKIPWLRTRYIFAAQEELSKLFCSELASEALERGGVIDPINASEVTPIDACRLRYRGEWIFGPRYYQIKGFEQEIRL